MTHLWHDAAILAVIFVPMVLQFRSVCSWFQSELGVRDRQIEKLRDEVAQMRRELRNDNRRAA